MELEEEYFTGDQHHQQILSLLNEQRLKQEMSDVILIADEEQFHAHRCVLAAASEYFRSMFEEDHFAECKTKEIQLHSISKEALRVILELVYLGHMKLTVGNMHSVLEASDHLLLNNAKWFCVTFMLKVLQSDIASEEVLKIRQSANVFSLPNLKYQAELVMQQKFTAVTKSQAFVELTCEEVVDILSLEDAVETEEYIFFEACLRWIGHMTESRLQYVDELMQFIRFPLMAADTLISIVRPHPWISRSSACLAYVQEAVDYLLLPERQSASQTQRTKPRCSRSHYGVLYCISGAEHFKCYVPGHDRWYSLRAPPMDKLPAMYKEAVRGEGGNRLHVRLLCLSGYVFASVQSTSPREVGHVRLVALLVYDVGDNEWSVCSLPKGELEKVETVEGEGSEGEEEEEKEEGAEVRTHSGRMVIVATNATLYACSRRAVYRYSMEGDQWEIHTSVNLDPCQFVVSSDCCLYFYHLEAGILQTVWLDKRSEQEITAPKQVIMTPNRFIADVQACTKLPNSEVFLQLRTITGISRKIFNLRSNLWRDCSISHGLAPLQPRAGVHYPLCIDPADQWEVVCDKRRNCLYVLASKSGLSDIPPTKEGNKVQGGSDAVLPFYRLDMESREWKRLACLPENMQAAAGGVQLCISDGDDSMAVF